MAGWDEGNVFFSDQAAAFREGDDAGLTAPVARRKFVHFLNNFRSEPSPGRADGETLYKDRLDAMRPSGGQAELHAEPVTLTITVQLEDLIAHDPELADKLKQKPAEYMALVRAEWRQNEQRPPHPPPRRSWRRPAWTCSCRCATSGWRTRNCSAPPSKSSLTAHRQQPPSETSRRAPRVDSSSRSRPAHLRSQALHVTKLVCVPGIVIAASRCKACALSARAASRSSLPARRPRPPR